MVRGVETMTMPITPRPSQRSYPRVARLNQVVREVLAEEIERVADFDDRLELVTITDVSVDPDMRHALVFVSRSTDAISEALEEARPGLQHAVARQTRMKRTPLLRFLLDASLFTGERIETIIRDLNEDESE